MHQFCVRWNKLLGLGLSQDNKCLKKHRQHQIHVTKSTMVRFVFSFILCIVFSSFLFLPTSSANAASNQLNSLNNQTEKSLNINQVQAMATELKYLDELLTASVISYAFTGDKKWLERYQAHEPQLAELLKRLQLNQTPDDKAIILQINEANNTLVAIETQVIALVSEQRQAAQALINSHDYQDAKQRYLNANIALLDNIETRITVDQHKQPITNEHQLTLSNRERQWLSQHTVTIGIANWPPIIYQKANGEVAGIAGKIINQIALRTDLKFKLVTGSWPTLFEQFKQGKIDIMPDVYLTEERKQFGYYSTAYHQVQKRLFVLAGNQGINSITDLAGKTLVVPTSYNGMAYLRQHYPELNLITSNNVNESYNALLTGQADAILAARTIVQSQITATGDNALKILPDIIIPASPLHFFINKQHPVLLRIIQKTLDTLAVDKVTQANQAASDIDTLSEIQFLDPTTNYSTYYLIVGIILLLLLLGTAISAIVFRINENTLANTFASKRFKRSVVVALVGLALVLLLLTSVVVNNAERKTNQVLNYNLNTLLTSTQKQLNSWVHEELIALNNLGKNAELITMVEQLLTAERSPEALAQAPVQAQIRAFFQERAREFGEQGFFIIAPDMISIASRRNSNIGTRNVITEHYPNILLDVFNGNDRFIPPLRSDVTLNEDKILSPLLSSESNKLPATMFFATPIRAQNGKVIAILTQRIDPEKEFSNVLAIGFIGKSGETYAFSKQGILLSNVRFAEQLKTIGLIDKDESALLNLRILNPGKNLLTQPFTELERATWPLTLMAESATQGLSGSNLNGYKDYRGINVVGTWLWDQQLGLGIAAEVDQAESVELLNIFKYTLFGVLFIALMLLFGCTLFTLSLGTRATIALSRSHAELESIVEERTSKLKTSMQRTRSIIDNASDGIIVINNLGIIQDFSPAAEQMFGYSQAEMIGQAVSELMEQSFHLDQQPASNQQNSTSPHTIIEQIGIRKDGSKFNIGISVSDVIIEGEHLYTGMIRDITLRKTAVQALEKAKNSAIEASKAKSDFLANMSHEIRTPMNAIIGMSYLALQTELDTKQQDYVHKIHSSANALLGIINDILDFSKIEAGKLSLEQAPFSLHEVLNHVIEIISLKSKQKELELLIDLAPGLPTQLVGDSLRLGQIIINLASNAVKFTEQGEIIIKATLVSQNKQGALLQFSVQDTGIGMTPLQVDGLFDSFSQADASTTRKYGGTGLGLTISKNLAKMMGGDIWVKSQYQQGSTFSFTAQFGVTNEPVDVAKRSFTNAADIKMLIIDDSLAAREILQTIANNIGFQTQVAESGRQAINTIVAADQAGSPINLVLTDWQMPDIDGVGLVQEMHSLTLNTLPKVIMITAFDRDDMLNACQHIQVDGFLTKPITSSTLFDVCSAVLGHSQQEEQHHPDSAIDTSPAIAIQGANILLVEDNEINQQIAVELLTMAKLNVDIAENGEIAIDKVLLNKYDAVLMDIHMPVMDGYQATKHIRKTFSSNELPILAMTANAMAGDREKCLAVGMNDHIAKPINPNDVFASLARWVNLDTRQLNSASNSTTTPPESAKPKNTEVAEFANIPGINSQQAIARMAGNVELYKKLLDKFVSSYQQSGHEISTQFAENNKQAAVRTAHTLKSVAANIGTDVLADIAAQVEETLLTFIDNDAQSKTITSDNDDNDSHGKQQLATYLEQLNDQLKSTITAITQAGIITNPTTQSTNSAIDTAAIVKLQQQLVEQLHDYDSNAQHTWQQLCQLMNKALSQELQQKITMALDNYDFDEAQTYLSEVEHAIKQLTV